jgi:hypothetical protein
MVLIRSKQKYEIRSAPRIGKNNGLCYPAVLSFRDKIGLIQLVYNSIYLYEYSIYIPLFTVCKFLVRNREYLRIAIRQGMIFFTFSIAL